MNASRSKANSVDSLGWQPHQSGGQVAPLAATTQRQVQLVICLGVGELSHCGLVSISVSASAKLLTGSSGSRPCHCRCHTMYQPRKRDTCDLAAAQLRTRRDGGTNAGIQPCICSSAAVLSHRKIAFKLGASTKRRKRRVRDTS